MTCTLTKIVSGNKNLRTDKIIGEFEHPPTVGRPFTLMGEPLDPTKSFRLVSTSPVTKVNRLTDTELIFNTHNSIYRLEISNGNGKSNDKNIEEEATRDC